MKFEYIKVEEKAPEWSRLEASLSECPAGHAVTVDGASWQKLSALVRKINAHSTALRAKMFKQGGKLCVMAVERLGSEGKPRAVAAEQKDSDTSKGVFTVTSLGGFYIEELSALANKHGAIRVPKSLFSGRDKNSLRYALTELRRRGHAVDGRAQRSSKSILIPKASGERVILRPDLKGKLFGKALENLERLTAPPAQQPAAPSPAAQVPQPTHAAPAVNGSSNGKEAGSKARRKGDTIRLTAPAQFPTGNRCFVCVGAGNVTVCGEHSVATYKRVKVCRTHMKLLQAGARLFARTSMTRGAFVLTK